MNRAEVTRLAKAKWGKNAVAEENKRAPDPETREIVRREYMRLKEEKPEPPPPTPEFLEYQRKFSEWKEQCSLLRGRCMGLRRYKIGQVVKDSVIGPYVTIHGDGDSWEEAARNAKLV